MAVEGKVEESFAAIIGDQSGLSAGQRARLGALADLLGIETPKLAPLRYQLFHRAAAAIFEADRYRSDKAILLVHSFSPSKTGRQDFVAFLHAAGIDNAADPSQLVGPKRIMGVDFYAVWIADELPKSSMDPAQVGDLNTNQQRLLVKTRFMCNDHSQYIWSVQCERGQCGHIYGANGLDFHQRKCPKCGGGGPGL